jgi:hypothetical protein
MGTSDSNKQYSDILDLFTYDISSFFYDDYEEIDSEETPATVMIVYEKKIPWAELDIFNTIQFRIFFDKENITGSNPINVKFTSDIKEISSSDLKNIIKKIVSVCGNDNQGNGIWSKNDKKAFAAKSFRKVWSIEGGESFITIEYNKDGLTLNILFFNNLIKNYSIVE